MDIEEARKVAAIVATAEGGCGGCCEQATADLNKQFPRFLWKLVEVPGFDHSIDVELDPVFMRPEEILNAHKERLWAANPKEPKKFGNCGQINREWEVWDKARLAARLTREA